MALFWLLLPELNMKFKSNFTFQKEQFWYCPNAQGCNTQYLFSYLTHLWVPVNFKDKIKVQYVTLPSRRLWSNGDIRYLAFRSPTPTPDPHIYGSYSLIISFKDIFIWETVSVTRCPWLFRSVILSLLRVDLKEFFFFKQLLEWSKQVWVVLSPFTLAVRM